MAAAATKRGFVFPRALPADAHRITLQGIYHPLVQQAVPNTLEITPDNHILFLTGANMAGKSTFMKTMGIVLFLAHMGFPVPASFMEFSVLDGIFTTINLPDDLGMGVSHFYAEVQRIKKIAQQLHQGKKLFVIFDELFRGTNVKDAYEATIALTTAFAGKRDSILLLSTHIIEAGEVLARQDHPIDFIYLPTRMEGSRPVYTYLLEKGITADRHGMVIIGNEGIFDILKNGGSGTGGAAGARAHGEGQGDFVADQQTLSDLNLTGKYKPGSIYSLFNKVHTEGAQRLLDEMFRRPLTDPDAINARSGRFQTLQERAPVFPFTREQLQGVEEYLHLGGGGSRLAAMAGILRMRVMEAAVKDQRYEQVRAGVQAVVTLLAVCRRDAVRSQLYRVPAILDDPRLADLAVPLSWQQVARYHHLFGTLMEDQLRQLCDVLYELDLAIAVGRVAKERGFTYARALPRQDAFFRAVDCRHPGVDRAVGNTLTMSRDSNLIFLTGANMAGKSTLMKSFGIAVYLAHMGFPVAAKEMEFSIRDGLYTSINVPDDLNRGHSHFYAEALRVKDAATAISEGRQLVVIFDELFKGTNVKDAHDATLGRYVGLFRLSELFFYDLHAYHRGGRGVEAGQWSPVRLPADHHGRRGAPLYLPAGDGYHQRPAWHADH